MAAPTPRHVMRTYLAVVGLFNLSASLIWGVNTLFLLGAGLTFTQTFIANAAFSAGMLLFEIPTGVVADTLGRRISFLLSLVMLIISTLAYVALFWMQAGIVPFVAVSVFLGLGFTFYTGAVEAWVVDAMQHAKSDMPLDKVFGRGGQIQGLAMLIGTLGGGVLATFSLAAPYLVRAGLLLVCIVVAAVYMRDWGFQPDPDGATTLRGQVKGVLSTSIRDGWRNPAVRNLLLAGTMLSSFLIWAWYAWQPLIVELSGGHVWVAGAVAAAISIIMIVGNGLAPWLSKKTGDRAAVMMAAIALSSLAFLGVAGFSTFWPVLLAFLAAMLAVGVVEPIRGAMVHHLIPSRTRATVISFGGMLASSAGVFTQVAFAAYSETRSIQAGYAIGALWILLAAPFIMAAARRNPDACDPRVAPDPPPAAAGMGVLDIDA